jgi:ABC transport system ATP-binding/permease protein
MSAPTVVSLEGVTVMRGPRRVLDDVTVGLTQRERVGVVGRNGAGKSTLVLTLGGVLEPDSGLVRTANGVHIKMVAQADVLDPDATVRDVVIGTKAEHEWAGDARIRDALAGLLGGTDAGAIPGGLEARIGNLSGGERRRVALAEALVHDSELLILDEPTNHLDLSAIAWLAEHLAKRRGSLLVVTHDRWLLDAVSTSTWEVADGKVHVHEGGYAAWVLDMAERDRQGDVTEDKRKQAVKRELAWLRRGAPARTSKPKFRIDAAEALIANEPPPRDKLSLAKLATARLGKDVYDLEDVTLRPAPGVEPVLRDVTWRLGPGDRIGLLGANGAGKSTLLSALLGEKTVDSGLLKIGRTVKPARLDQEPVPEDPDDRVLAALERLRSEATVRKEGTIGVRQLLEGFGFRKERLTTRLGDLSGGELRRFTLLLALLGEPNVLLLDEPTNDLDTETLAVLEQLLDEWPGTVIVVSHDRYFLERVTDDVYALLGDGRLRHLPGGVDEYLALVEMRKNVAHTAAAPPKKTPAATADIRAARKELTRLERRLEKLTSEETRLHGLLAANATDVDKIMTFDAELRTVLAEKASVEEEWLTLAETVEQN